MTTEDASLSSSQLWTPDNYKANQNRRVHELYPPQKAAGNLTTQQFYSLLYYLLEVEQPDLIFAPAYPNFLVPGTKEYEATMDNPTEKFRDTVTYKITKEEPGSRGGGKQPFEGATRELRPTRRETLYGDNKAVNVYGQIFDTLIQFDVWSLTNYEVDKLAIFFKRLMTTYRGFFREMGLGECFFWWRGIDDVTRSLRNNVHFRTLVYYVRTEEISIDEDPILKEIKYKVEQKFREGG